MFISTIHGGAGLQDSDGIVINQERGNGFVSDGCPSPCRGLLRTMERNSSALEEKEGHSCITALLRRAEGARQRMQLREHLYTMIPLERGSGSHGSV